jgi:hypothetical protein
MSRTGDDGTPRTLDDLGADDRQFLSAFEHCTLSPAAFRHRDHVRLAFIYLTLHDADTALSAMRSGLQRFLAHVGAPASKYHETITRAWLLAVEHFMREAGPVASFDQFAAAAPRLFVRGAMETHYTRELLSSDEARQRFVEPDLQPIPPHAPAA